MFGRDKTRSAEADPAPEVAAPRAGGKGRPTPSRKEAQARNRRPVVGAPVPVGATREERKKIRNEQRDKARLDRVRQRELMMAGDDRALPPRDRGPARRYVRDYVDARRNVGEYFLPVALVSLLAAMVRSPVASLTATIVMYGGVLLVVADSLWLRRKVTGLVREKFGADSASGVGMYAIIRAIQFRRSRAPRPQVARWQYPS